MDDQVRRTALVPPAMLRVFRGLSRRCGDRPGYYHAFYAYWATCSALPLAVAGPPRLARLLRRPAGAAATELAPRLPRTGPQVGRGSVRTTGSSGYDGPAPLRAPG